jgi:hypothetical protein
MSDVDSTFGVVEPVDQTIGAHPNDSIVNDSVNDIHPKTNTDLNASIESLSTEVESVILLKGELSSNVYDDMSKFARTVLNNEGDKNVKLKYCVEQNDQKGEQQEGNKAMVILPKGLIAMLHCTPKNKQGKDVKAPTEVGGCNTLMATEITILQCQTNQTE